MAKAGLASFARGWQRPEDAAVALVAGAGGDPSMNSPVTSISIEHCSPTRPRLQQPEPALVLLFLTIYFWRISH